MQGVTLKTRLILGDSKTATYFAPGSVHSAQAREGGAEWGWCEGHMQETRDSERKAVTEWV